MASMTAYPKAKAMPRKQRKSSRNKIFQENRKATERVRKEREASQ